MIFQQYSGLSTGEAFERLKSAVVKRGGRVVEEQAELNYIRAELPFGKEMDVAEFKLIADPDVILYREFSLINKPDPPGCLGFGCINGKCVLVCICATSGCTVK